MYIVHQNVSGMQKTVELVQLLVMVVSSPFHGATCICYRLRSLKHDNFMIQ